MSRIIKVVVRVGNEGFTSSETLTNQNENTNPENPKIGRILIQTIGCKAATMNPVEALRYE